MLMVDWRKGESGLYRLLVLHEECCFPCNASFKRAACRVQSQSRLEQFDFVLPAGHDVIEDILFHKFLLFVICDV